MKNIFKKTLSLTLGLALALGTLTAGSGSLANAMDSFTIKASAAEVATSGKCGENLTWNLDDEGTLTISGTGEMNDYSDDLSDYDVDFDYVANPSPWCGNKNVKNVIIDSGVTKVGSSAFSNCSNLMSVTIPDSVTEIGLFLFAYCSKLTSIKIDKRNTVYDSRNECNAIIRTADNTLVAGCLGTIIPDTVTSIGHFAFGSCIGLANITIPKSVISIGHGAFLACYSLTGITIPDDVTTIGKRAFMACQNLIRVTFGKDSKLRDLGSSAFDHCLSLTSITIPDGVASIGDYTFSCCSNIKSIVIPDSVTNIGSYAFSGCTSLTSITIPNSVTNIYSNAFVDCINLRDVYYAGSKNDREAMKVADGNEALLNATWHYNNANNHKTNFFEKIATAVISAMQKFYTFISNIFKFR